MTHRTRPRARTTVAVVFMAHLIGLPTMACPYSLRDAAFLGVPASASPVGQQNAPNGPLADRLREDLLRSWAVLVLIHPTDTVREAANTAARDLLGRKTDTGENIDLPTPVVELDPNRDEDTAIARTLELLDDKGQDDRPKLALMVGPARRRGPVLTGPAITPQAVLEMLVTLGRSCSCFVDPCWLDGPALALDWGSDYTARVQTFVGFDPNDPHILREVGQAVRSATPDDPAFSYEEIDIAAVTRTSASSTESQDSTTTEAGIDENLARDADRESIHTSANGHSPSTAFVVQTAVVLLATLVMVGLLFVTIRLVRKSL